MKKVTRLFSLSPWPWPTLLALLLMASFLLAVGSARAEWSENFVRVACLKNAGIMQIEPSVQEDPTVQVNTQTPAANNHRHSLWAKEGFYTPDGASQACSIKGNRFVFKAHEQYEEIRGCGQPAVIRLSVSKNGKKIFDDVPFGGRCNGDASISTVVISATTLAAPDEMLICIERNGKADSINYVGEDVTTICAYYNNAPPGISIPFPIKEK